MIGTLACLILTIINIVYAVQTPQHWWHWVAASICFAAVIISIFNE